MRWPWATTTSAGPDAPEHIAQGLGRGEIAGEKFSRGQVERGDAVAVRVRRDGGDEIVALRLELAGVEDAAGREDLRDLAPHDLTRLRCFHLVANGHTPPGLEQLGDVALGRVVGHAAHGRALALGQREVEQARALLGVGEEHLVEIAEPEEQEGVGRDLALEPMILLHHGSQGVGHGGRD